MGKVINVSRAEAAVTVRRHAPVSDGRLRLKWVPLFLEGGVVTLATGTQTHTETVAVKHVVCTAQLHDGVLSHAVARRLDKGGFVFDDKEFQFEQGCLDVPRCRPEPSGRLADLCAAICGKPTVGLADGRSAGCSSPCPRRGRVRNGLPIQAACSSVRAE